MPQKRCLISWALLCIDTKVKMFWDHPHLSIRQFAYLSDCPSYRLSYWLSIGLLPSFFKPKNLSCRNLNEYFSPYSAKNSVASRPSFHSWASHAWQRRSRNLWVTLTQLPIWFINQRQSSVAYINLRHSTHMYANLHDLVLVCAKPSSIYVNLHQFLRIYAIYSQFTSNLHRSMPTFANLQQIRRLLIHANL